MLGVTGPNEYENKVNNSWYRNTIACWTMEYTLEQIKRLAETKPSLLNEILGKSKFNKSAKTSCWQEIINNIYLPEDEEKQVFL